MLLITPVEDQIPEQRLQHSAAEEHYFVTIGKC